MVARDEVLVSPEVDGLAIVELLAEEGDRVKEGQVLARLSRVTLEVQKTQNEAQQQRAEAGISQARAQIAEAQANLVQAQNAFDRTKTLRETGNASVEQFDQRASAARGADARLNAATAGARHRYGRSRRHPLARAGYRREAGPHRAEGSGCGPHQPS